MEILRPDTWEEALALKAAHPAARPIAGGTDLMVELNFDRTRPAEILDLTRVAELAVAQLGAAIGADDLAAFLAQPPGRRPSDPLAGAGHDAHFVLEPAGAGRPGIQVARHAVSLWGDWSAFDA